MLTKTPSDAARAVSRIISARQEARLRRLLKHVKSNSPFFRDLYAGIDIESASIEMLPILRKCDIIGHFDDYITVRNIKRTQLDEYFRGKFDFERRFRGAYYAFHTSGSSGTPSYVVWREREFKKSCSLIWQANLDRLQLLSVRPRVAYVGIMDDYVGGNSWVHGLREHAEVYMLSIFAAPAEMAVKLNEFQPNLLASKPHVVANLARMQLSGDLNLYSLQDIVFAGENISVADDLLIQRAFGLQPRNSYSTCETGPIARQMSDEKVLQVLSDDIIVEIVDEVGIPVTTPGLSGRVVVTNLYNRLMPTIRYDVGDVASVCSFRNGVRKISYVQGRASSVLNLSAAGRAWSISEFPLWSLYVPPLGRYQVIQLAPDRLHVKLEWSQDAGSSTVKEVARRAFHDKFCRALGSAQLVDQLTLSYEDVSEIELSKSGKAPMVIPLAR